MKFSSRTLWLLSVVVLTTAATRSASAQTKLLRFPDVGGDKVVFCYAADLWRASINGGTAVRLTAHPGQELFPKLSPDGRHVAFTAQYDGDEQVYVMPIEGGQPRQLTYYPAHGPLAPRWGYDHQVYGWSPDGKYILFRSLRDADGVGVNTALYRVAVTGGLPDKLPMPTAGAGDFSPDGQRILYSPLFRDFRTWKRYQGGWAQDLFIFDLQSHQARRIASSRYTERDPMWIGKMAYFVSDRDGVLNLYACDPRTDDVKQLTRHKTWDVRWASSDQQRRIVYELNGELRLFDAKSKRDRKLSIKVPHDGLAMRPSRYSAADNIEDVALGPQGKRALLVARGDVFTVPPKQGPTRNLTNTSSAHDKWARWSHDGAYIAFISDESGEDQVYRIRQDGSKEAEQLTRDFRGMLFAAAWSPDDKRLALSDKDGKLYVLNVDDQEILQVAHDQRGGVHDYCWSPRGGYLAYSLRDENEYSSVYIWSVSEQVAHRVTGESTDDYEPVWDSKGDFLFYLSRRQYSPQISTVEWNFAGNRQEGIFALALRADVAHPFEPQSDEVEVTDGKLGDGTSDESGSDTESEEEKSSKDKSDESDAPIEIEFHGLAQRVTRIPIEADNLSNLTTANRYLFYVTQGARFYGRGSARKPSLMVFDFEEREATTLVEGVSSYSLSPDGSKAIVRLGGGYQLLDAKPGDSKKQSLDTSGLMVDRVPAEEWAEVFDEVWRRYRDFFYVDNLHGYDWQAIGERYRKLLPHVAHRADLNYLIGEMIAELSVGHAYISGGDYEIPERPESALMGARFELDAESRRYRIARVLSGQNEEAKYRAPLTEIGVNVEPGDYVLAIDGEPLHGDDNPYRLLQHKSELVTLTVSKRPTLEDAREVVYRPIADEQPLLYLDFVLKNMEKVAQATDGRVGYLHVPDMGDKGIYEFIKWYYPQIRKEGLVIDVRSNGGGNVSQWLIERLNRKLLGTWFGSTSKDPGTYPDAVFIGHLVCLLNETSASDGDIFPHMFREAGLGPLIGKRSWGGVVGISGRGPLIDGGTVYVPLVGMCSAEGQWVIEGYGVEPDIEVENDPQAVLEGRDPQLERGIKEVMQRIETEPRKLPPRPVNPVKTP